MSTARRMVALLAAGAALGVGHATHADEPPADLEVTPELMPAPDLARGSDLYGVRCAVCHGGDGDGQGPVARFLDPRPRDFTRAVYKLRTTPSGTLPTDADLYRVITRGIPGTAMLGWGGLSAADRWQLVHYIKSLSPRFAAEGQGAAIAVSVAPPATADDLARGAGVYRVMGCHMCHGNEGRGDGPSVSTLVDDAKQPIRAFDMTRAWKLKGGTSPEDVYRTFHTGLDGTPMPSYRGVLSERDSWALVAFVRSLFVDRHEN